MDEGIDIDDLYEIAESVAAELEEHLILLPEIARKIPESQFPFTFFALLSFVPKVESIRIGIFEIVKAGDVYSVKILFRAIIEHFLKFQYIWMRHLAEKSDEVGQDYFLFCGAQEGVDFARSLRASAQILGRQFDIDPVEIMQRLDQRLRNETRKTIKRRAEMFTHRSVVAYISGTLRGENSELSIPFLDDIIPAYSELSSFVHGGPSTVRQMKALIDPNTAREELRSHAAVSLQMSFAVKAHTYLLLAKVDSRMMRPFQVVNKAMKSKASD